MPVSWSCRLRPTASSQMGAFEPPVAEEFGVEGRAEDGRDGFVEAGVERLVDEMDEVGGVLLDALGGLLRVVDELVAHVDAWSR